MAARNTTLSLYCNINQQRLWSPLLQFYISTYLFHSLFPASCLSYKQELNSTSSVVWWNQIIFLLLEKEWKVIQSCDSPLPALVHASFHYRKASILYLASDVSTLQKQKQRKSWVNLAKVKHTSNKCIEGACNNLKKEANFVILQTRTNALVLWSIWTLASFLLEEQILKVFVLYEPLAVTFFFLWKIISKQGICTKFL